MQEKNLEKEGAADIWQEGIHYLLEETAAVVQETCEELEGEVKIPDEVQGLPVKRISPYAFARKRVEELHLPGCLEEVGRYVFYRCFALRRLCFTDSWKEIGAGVFTGCRLSELEIDFYRGERSCLKFIVDEVRYEICVTMRYHREDGQVETAKVLFPEHYEEAVENTPARIVETHRHGSGGYYRQCFYNRALNYAEYDSLLPWAAAGENEVVTAKIAVLRLRFPYRLSGAAKEKYEAWLVEHIEDAGRFYALAEDTETLRFFGRNGYWTREAIEQAIDAVSVEKKTEVLSVLLEERRRYFPKKKKIFEL